MFFHALTFAGSRESCLNMRPLGTESKMFDRILAFYMIPSKIPSKTPENHAKVAALYTSFDSILFFALCDVIPNET